MELTLDQALQKGIEAHKAGKFQEADSYYTAILKANPKHSDANHNMGVLAVGVEKVEEALPFFKIALDANPKIAQYWLSYIDALIKLDRMADAKAVFDQAKSKGTEWDGFDQLEERFVGLDKGRTVNANSRKLQEPPQKQVQPLVNLYMQGQSAKALTQAFQLMKKFPNSINLYNIIGAANQSLGKLDKAIEAYDKAISIKPDYAEAYNNMGVVFKDQGKLVKAIEAYDKAISIKPNYAEAHNNLGNALQDQGELNKAIETYEKAISIKPDYAEAYNNMGVVFKDQGKLEEAIEAYNEALSLRPDYADVWSNGAEALEKWNKLDHLEIWLKKAFNSFETVPADLLFIKCKLLWRNRKYEETSNLLENIKFETISEIRKKSYLHLKAKHFEKFKRFDEAYACFAQSNLLVKESKEYSKHNAEKYFKDLRNSLDKLKSSSGINSKVNSVGNPEFSPTFLVGFPRSGTTLLDTILRSNSKINVVEEQDMLWDTKSFLRQNGRNDFVTELIPPQLNVEAQKIYKREFNKHIDTTSANKVYIDKLPLNLLQAPLIHQLYPDAKFILALRHPMDTILSCWMQNFKLNAPMANMVDLDRIVEFYCVAMETFKICRTNYNLNVYEIRYEDLINNFQKEATAVVQFLNLQWEPEMERYQETALKRGRINTPSYSQVVQPIYKDAQYRWLNYQKYLEQYLDRVKLWISEFGYS